MSGFVSVRSGETRRWGDDRLREDAHHPHLPGGGALPGLQDAPPEALGQSEGRREGGEIMGQSLYQGLSGKQGMRQGSTLRKIRIGEFE